MKLGCYQLPGEPCQLIIPADGKDHDQAWFEREAAKSGLTVNCRVIDQADLPSSRQYRDAWRDTGTKIDVDATLKAAIDTDMAAKGLAWDATRKAWRR